MNKVLLVFFFALVVGQSHGKIHGPLSTDFSQWLDKNGYSKWRTQFERKNLGQFGSYGGKTEPDQLIKNNPVVFIHGNSDQALDSGTRYGLTGWTQSIRYFTSKGYTSAELYATTWGPTKITLATVQTHSCAYLTMLRQFTNAVIGYTNSSKISMISHSMGVTLARKVVKGGTHTDSSGKTCDLGGPLTNTVDTFVGISGGNRGLALCAFPPGSLVKSCNGIDGFDPGHCLFGYCSGNAPGMSKYLKELNSEPNRMEGENIFTIWSPGDAVLGFTNLVYGKPTSRIPGQDGEKVYSILGHIDCKDKTGAVQFAMVTNHTAAA